MMRLLAFHADAFGILADTGAQGLGPGINIFLGNNEAGKSTCLDFLRAMLTGYPSGRRERHTGLPLRGGRPGGSLTLADDRHGELHLYRSPGPGGGPLRLSDPDGASLPESLLEQLFQGITRQVYAHVFAFSLGELQRFESLDDEAVRHALYGATFGTGLRSPAEVLRALRQQADAIYRPQGRKLPLNAQAAVWQELRGRIRQADAESSRYDALCAQWLLRRQELETLRRDRDALEAELRRAERRLPVWDQWREQRLLERQLERLSHLPQDFPPQGREQLSRLREREAAALQEVRACEEDIARLREQLRGLRPDPALVAALPRVRLLGEQTGRYRQALADLPQTLLRRQQLERELREELARLGPDWDCARIRAADRSIFGREEVERVAAALREADTAWRLACRQEEEAAAALARADEALREQQHRLAALPAGQPPLDEEQQARLLGLLDRRQEKKAGLPRWQRRRQRAGEAFARACAPLGLAAEDPAGPEQLLRQRDEALALAARWQRLTEEQHDLQRRQERIRRQQATLRQREADMVRQGESLAAPEADALEQAAAAVRDCRRLRAGMAAEQIRLEGLEQQAARLARPRRGGNGLLLCLGLVLALAGLGILAAGYWAPDLLPRPEITALSTTFPWSGALPLACGLILLLGGLPHAGAAERQRREEWAQVRELREGCAARLRQQAHRLARLPLPGMASARPPETEALEQWLEKQRDLRRQLDQILRELDGLRRELRALAREQAGLAEREEALALALREEEEGWTALLPGAAAAVSGPAGAGALFQRAAGAATLAEALRAARDDADHAEAALREVEEGLRGLLGPLAPEADDDLPEAVRRCLALCREAGAARERHRQAAAETERAAGLRERCRRTLDDCRTRVADTAQQRDRLREQWATGLRALGLPEDLTPETVRTALDGMAACLRLEAEQEQEAARLRGLRADVDALRAPLAALLGELGQSLPPKDGDWPQRLDALRESVEAAHAEAGAASELARRLQARESELRRRHEGLERIRADVAALLRRGGARDDAAFLQTAALLEERRRLEQRRCLLEDSLRLVAGDQPLTAFLAGFREEARDEEEQACALRRHQLEELRRQEEELAGMVADLNVRVETMRQDGTLADLLREEAGQREELRRQAHDWCRLRLAHALLHRAKLAFEKERQPRVIRQAAAIFRDITDGAWQDVGAVVGEWGLRILPPRGEPVGPEQLSRGTQEQLYLALRLAYIQDHALRGQGLPVIMDDVLVDFDPGRAERTARILAACGRGDYGVPQQFLVFTCHPRTAALLREAQPDAPLFLLEDGRIRPGAAS